MPTDDSGLGEAAGRDSQSTALPSEAFESRQEGAWPDATEENESGFLTRQAHRLVGTGPTAFHRIYRAFISARAALGMALIATVSLGRFFGVAAPAAVSGISAAYAALALSMWLLPRLWPQATVNALARLRSPQWLATIGIDITCFVSLHAVSELSALNYVALLVLPVLMAGVLTPRRIALATSAGVTLLLLAVAWAHALAGGEPSLLMAQAGLAGSGFFVITLLAGELAGRLAREELSAKGSLELARQQAQLNRLVIEEMQEGVLVVDRRGRVRTANPAARQLLAADEIAQPAPFALRSVAAWSALVEVVEQAFAEGNWPEEGRDAVLNFDSGLHRTLRVRVRFTRRRQSKASEALCVLFLEDLRSMQARTRQEKLAAMGRVSAGIAHEIRNPLATIAQANALMSEDATTPSQRQLTRMVSDNVERLKRIIDDVMEVAPGETRDPGVIDATRLIAASVEEWSVTAGLSLNNDSPLQVTLPAHPLGVIFDPEHLRRVLINLLDNARRHASPARGALRLVLEAQGEQAAVLRLFSDGAPIPPDVERYLFEPFFSTRSRGTGLGLYICRELCERYAARIDYRLTTLEGEPRNEFFVSMRCGPLPPDHGSDARLHLSA